MSPDVHAPRPMRPQKRPLLDIDPDFISASKHRRLWQRLSSPAPLTKTQPLEVPHPSHRPSSASSPPRPSIKRALEDLNSDCAPPNRNRRVQSSTDSPIDAWLSDVLSSHPCSQDRPSHRPKSCPAAIDSRKYVPALLETIKQMSQQQYAESAGPRSGSSQNSRPATSHPLYKGTLLNNFVTLDYSGRRIPQPLRRYADAHILKQRGSPQLGDESVSKVIETAEELADSTEGPTMKLIRTPMFPIERPGIGEGGDSPWSTTALPNNPEYEYDLSAPKPDVYLGYPSNQRSGWSYTQNNVINHPTARPYTQPGRGPTFPCLMVEIKSEPAGGTLCIAENQAAGSGSHSVQSMLWLLREAGLSDSHILHPLVLRRRPPLFHVYLKSYSTLEPGDIRACNNTVKNILDHVLGPRKTMIGNALQALFPFQEHWKQSRPASSAPSTPATSFTEDARPTKRHRRR